MADPYPLAKAQGRVDIFDRRINISVYHDKIHRGEMFSMFGESILNDTETTVYHIKTGAKEIHIYGTIAASATGTVKVYKTPTVTVDGTPITFFNNNDNFDTSAATAAPYLTPTTTSLGTQINSYLLGTDKKAGGETRDEHERVWAPNSSYLIIITSEAAGNEIVARFSWYEVE